MAEKQVIRLDFAGCSWQPSRLCPATIAQDIDGSRGRSVSEPRYVDVDGKRTRYLGAGDGEPMVLVHGGHFGTRSSAEDWELNLGRLGADFSVYAIDKLGMGFTDNPDSDSEYTIDAHAVHLAGFVEALDLGPTHLVGHSRGGYAVTRMALDHPDLVKTLTVVSSSSVTNPFNPVYGEWRAKAETMEEREAVRYLISSNSYSDEHITDSMVNAGVEIGRLEKTKTAKDLMNGGLYETFKEHLLERIKDIEDEVGAGALQTPTLVLWGFNDPSATVERCLGPAIDLFLENVADSELHIFNQAGHYCYREQPDAFADTVIGFISRHRKHVA